MDYKEQQKSIGEQQKMQMDIQKELMEEMQAEQQIDQGAGQGQAPMDINSQAQQIAMQLLSMPEEYRVRQMRSIEQMNPTLHALVKQVMEKTRNAARTERGYENLAAAGMVGHQIPPQ